MATYHLGAGPVAPNVQVHRIGDVPSYGKLGPGPALGKLLRVDPALAALLRRLLRRERFDVIHAHHVEGVLVSAVARVGLGVPLVFDAHTLLASELPYYRLGLPSGAKAALGRFGDRLVPRLADHTACVTETIRAKLVGPGGIDPNRVSVVSNGTEIDHFDPARVRPVLPRSGRTLIFTGNLAEYQGIDLMLKAFQRVAADCPDVRLLVASDSSFAPYEALARALGIRERVDIEPSPAFADLPRLLASAEIALNPRENADGIPVKLLNYMAAARATVSFAGSAPGVSHGVNGWLATSGDIDAFAAGITALLQDPARARTMGAAARDYVVEHASWPKAAERCERIYESLRTRMT